MGFIRRLGNCTRDEIAAHLGWQPATISRTLGPLLNNGWVCSRSLPGGDDDPRRRARLAVADSTMLAIGVEIGFKEIRFAPIDAGGNLLQPPVTVSHAALPAEKTIRVIGRELKDLCRKTGRTPVLGIGVSFSGSLTHPDNASFCFPGAARWNNVPLRTAITKLVDLPVHVCSDNTAAVLAEMRYGHARRCDHFIYLHMLDGIGLGIVMNGTVHVGAGNLAGEFGHTRTMPQGPVCYCGGSGCLESVASSWAILNQVHERLSRGVYSRFLGGTAPDNLTLRDICSSVQSGDNFARDLLETAGDWLGMSLGNVSDLLDPEKIILGGILADEESYQPIINRMKQSYLRNSPFYRSRDIPVLNSALGHNTHLIGAAATVFEATLPAYPPQLPTCKESGSTLSYVRTA